MTNWVKTEDTLPEVVLRHARMQPDKNAVCAGENAYTYSRLADMIERCSALLVRAGAKRGDAVVLSALMKVEYIAAFLAVKRLRMIAVPVSKSASEKEVEYIIARVGAKIFLTDNPRYKALAQTVSLRESCRGELPKAAEIPEMPESVPGDEITEILFTSGTTGEPKGAMLSQSGICASTLNTANGMDMRADDVILMPLPLNHSFGLRVMRAALHNGETLVLQNGFSFAKELAGNIERWRCNCMVAVNSGFEMLQQQMGEAYKAVFQRLRYIEFSAGAVPEERRRQLIEDLPGVRLHNTWGSTETGAGLFLEFSSQPEKMKSAGHALGDIRLAVIGEDGQMVPTGQLGRLALSGATIMSGYYGAPELTAVTLHDGWLWTNDLACIDEEGYVFLHGRVDDIISVGGEKVAPADIERIVRAQPGVSDCACCGVEDWKGVLGQVPVAFVVTGEGKYDPKQIEAAIRRDGNGYMVPAAFVVLPELPRNYMGKVDRAKLKKLWQERKETTANKEKDFAASVLNLMLNRRSIRNFREATVEDQKLQDILTAGRYAPSGHNMQTWKFTVIRDRGEIEHLRSVTKQVAARVQSSFYGFLNPPCLIIVSNNRKNILAKQDSSAAIENMLLMAHAHGLGACWLNSWISISDEPEIRELLDRYGIPQQHIVYGIVAVGYAANPVKTPAKKENVVFYYDGQATVANVNRGGER